MKIIEAINLVDRQKPNNSTDLDKIRWLSELDGKIKHNIIDTHEGGASVEFNGYDENTSDDTVLLVPAPYDDVYIKWLESRIDYENGEIAKYNNSVLLFNTKYSEFSRWYHRTHMPKNTTLKFY